MTPQEKAKELCNKYFIAIPFADELYGKEIIVSKRCALIAVQEIMKSYEDTNAHHGSVYKYWQQVKEEIQKL